MEIGDVAVWLGILVTGAIGAWGLVHSSQANTTSDGALELAKSADARADRLEQIATERRDIEWQQTWHPDRLVLSFLNGGTDTAYDVELTVDLEEAPRRTEGPRQIAPQEAIGHTLTSSTRDAAVATAGDVWEASVTVSARLTWRSAAGVYGIRVWPHLSLGFEKPAT